VLLRVIQTACCSCTHLLIIVIIL